MAYPIFFCIFSKYIVLYVYKIKEEKDFFPIKSTV